MPHAVTLQEMMAAREERVRHQKQLLAEWRRPLVCFTLNVPGPVKTDPLLHRAFREGARLLRQSLDDGLLYVEDAEAPTGDTAYLVADLPAEELKRRTLAIEESCAIGRLFDMDVLDRDDRKIERTSYGLSPRRCLLCGRPAVVCGRSRTHTVEELTEAVHACIAAYFCQQDADKIGSLAARALLYEVCVTPKPGLVDRHDSGAHRDMNIYTFQASTAALQPWLSRFAKAGLEYSARPDQLFAVLRELGLQAEEAMYQATGQVNTHKGAIFTFALLCGAAGSCLASGQKPIPEAVLARVRRLCDCSGFSAQAEAPTATAGAALYRQGVGGLRTEAAGGFATAAQVGLPVLERLLDSGSDEDTAGAVALLAILRHAQDTCFIKRGGAARLAQVQAELAALPEQPAACLDEANRLNDTFIAENLSPGGCADLLAVCWFLHFCRMAWR